MQELSALKLENKNLKEQLKHLKQSHELTLMELADSKDHQRNIQKLYNTLLENISNNQNEKQLPEIRISLNGDFSTKRISELQRQLQDYRSGVNASVDRRVRQIINQYQELNVEPQGNQMQKSVHKNNVNINYHVKQQKKTSQCKKCQSMNDIMDQYESLLEQLEQTKADNIILSNKLAKCQELIETLKKQNNLLSKQVENSNQIEEPKRKETLRAFKSDYKENQIRQLTSIISELSNRKQVGQVSDSRRSKWPTKDSSSLFSIKNGINRPSQNFF